MATFKGTSNRLESESERMIEMMKKVSTLSGPKGNTGVGFSTSSMYEQNPYGSTSTNDSTRTVATSTSSYDYEPHTMKRTSNVLVQRDAHAVDQIMQMREEIEELVEGKHTLSPYFGKGTVREMIKELRTDIRIIKYENELTELDIIKTLVLEKEKGTRYEPETSVPSTGLPGEWSRSRTRGMSAAEIFYDEVETDPKTNFNGEISF